MAMLMKKIVHLKHAVVIFLSRLTYFWHAPRNTEISRGITAGVRVEVLDASPVRSRRMTLCGAYAASVKKRCAGCVLVR